MNYHKSEKDCKLNTLHPVRYNLFLLLSRALIYVMDRSTEKDLARQALEAVTNNIQPLQK